MKQVKARIAENRKIAESFYRMRIEAAYLGKEARPGQFVEALCARSKTEPLLRRPFSVHRISKSGIEILYEVVGNATEALSRRKPGESIDVIGPLGNGFDLSPITQSPNNPITILIAGGIGVAPFVALAEAMKSSNTKMTVLIGARTKAHIHCENDFKKLGAEVLVATDDGSKGHRGFVTDLLKILPITQSHNDLITIYACGPHPMLKLVAHFAKERKIKCQVSLEERMACGVGVCLGCPVKIQPANEYKMVCKDGPVFDAEEVVW